MSPQQREDETYMRHAIELARRARAAGDTPVGSVVVKGSRVLAEGIEAVRAELDVAAHAELLALRAACRAVGGLNLSACTLYTTAEPCWMCSFALRQTRVARIVIGLPTPVIGGAGPPHPILATRAVPGWAPPPEIVRGVLAGDIAALR